MRSRPSGKQVRAERAHQFLMNGPIPIKDINDIILAFNQCFEGTLAHILQPHDTPIRYLATLNDGTLLCGSYNKTVRMDAMVMDGARVVTNNESSVYSMALLPDGKFALGSQDGEVSCGTMMCACVRLQSMSKRCALSLGCRMVTLHPALEMTLFVCGNEMDSAYARSLAILTG